MENTEIPNFNMYAIVENNIIIDCGFGDTEEFIVSPLTKKEYNNIDYQLIKCTPETGVFKIGQKVGKV
jgi:hypothetical protein